VEVWLHERNDQFTAVWVVEIGQLARENLLKTYLH
jgi:hypothetical protein